MAQTSIHICPVKGGSELHNERMKVLDYVKSDLSHLNQSWKSEDYSGINDQLKRIKEDYKHAHGKKLHEKATPIREAVVVITERTTIDQLRSACERCREKFGIDAMQIHIHRDEGHTDEDDIWKTNEHAHIVFNWYNFITHTTCKLSRVDMVAIQTIFADCLQMERGISSDVNHLNAIQQKNKAEAEKLHRIQERINEVNQELQTIQENVNTATQELHSIQEQMTKNAEEQITQEVCIEAAAKYALETFDYLVNLNIVSVEPTAYEKRHAITLAAQLKAEPPTDLQQRASRCYNILQSFKLIVKSLHRMVSRLKSLSHTIPFFKKNQIAREAQLQAEIEAVKAKDKEIREEARQEREAAANKLEEAKDLFKNRREQIDLEVKVAKEEVQDEKDKVIKAKDAEIAELKKELELFKGCVKPEMAMFQEYFKAWREELNGRGMKRLESFQKFLREGSVRIKLHPYEDIVRVTPGYWKQSAIPTLLYDGEPYQDRLQRTKDRIDAQYYAQFGKSESYGMGK